MSITKEAVPSLPKGDALSLPKGYKQTEVGVIPEDWEVVKLGDFIEFKNGLNKEKQFFGYGTPIINYMDVYRHSGIESKDINGRVFLTSNEINPYRVKEGDMFFTRTSETVDEIGISSVLVEDSADTVFSGFVLRGRDKYQVLNTKYKKYCFTEQHVRKQIIGSASYTTRALTNGKLLSKVLIKVPPIPEQTAIANALSDMDALIAQTEKLIEKKKAIKQGVMQELLKPKEGWVTKKLGDYIKFQTGFPFSSLCFTDNPAGIRLIKNRDLRSDDSIVFYNGVYSNDFLVQNGDLLIGMDGDFEPVLWGKGMALLNQRVGRIIKCKDISIEFLSYILLKELKKIESQTGSTTVKHLSHTDIEDIELLLPTINEQIKTGAILQEIDIELTKLVNKLQKLKHQKQGMMQALLTGKIRLI